MEPESSPKEPKISSEVRHDEFARIVWSNVFIARLFVERFMAPEVVREIDLNSLELVPTHNTTEKGRNSIGDIYYKFRFKSGKRGVLVVIVEHKSGYARFVAVQILRYEVDVLEFMVKNFDKFADENGRLPTPYSILLCQKHCPQLEDLTSRFEGVEYGPRTRFQEINFNDVDIDSLSDEPFLQIAMGLSRFAGYSDKAKDERQDELTQLFEALMNYDPSKRDQRREIWEMIFRVSYNYLQYIMRDRQFDLDRFVHKIIDSGKENAMTDYMLLPDVFAAMFPRELQAFSEPFIVAQTEARREVEEARAETKEANSRADKANSRAEATERLLCESTRERICETLKVRRLLEEIPQDLSNRLDSITSYVPLKDALTAAKTAENYEAFLQTLENVVQ